ncbi:MAG: hypothetical protein JJT78_13730, partial [Leptospira sp.]|nr:hypothetical protein [Leptospira sp.]
MDLDKTDNQLFPILEMPDSDPVYFTLKNDSDFKREYAGEKDAKVRNAYYSILRASNSDAVNAYFSVDTELDTLNYPRELVVELLHKRYIQQLFFIDYDISQNKLFLKNILVAGFNSLKCWKNILSRSLNLISHFIIKEKELDENLLREIFSKYNEILFMDYEIPSYSELTILNQVVDLGNPDIETIKNDFFNIIKLSLCLHPNYLMAPGIGFYFLLPQKVRKLLPYLDRKLDRAYTYRIPNLDENCLQDFKKNLGLFMAVRQRNEVIPITNDDLFYAKVHFLANYKMSHFVSKTRLLFEFIENTSNKLKIYEEKKLNSIPEKKVRVIKSMLTKENHFLSRILKVDIEDEILEGNVLDHLYGDPEIMHANYYDNKTIYLIFVQKNIENIKNLLSVLSSNNEGFEHSLLLDKVLDKYPNVKTAVLNNKVNQLSRLNSLYKYISRELNPFTRFLIIIFGNKTKEKYINKYMSQFKLNQLNLRMKFESDMNKQMNKNIDRIMNSIFKISEETTKLHINEAIFEMKLTETGDINFLKKI